MIDERENMQVEACLSEYRLDLHFFGGESPDEHEQSKRHIASCPRCQEDLRALEMASARASEVVLPQWPAASPWQSWWEWLQRPAVWGAAAAACGLLLFVSFGLDKQFFSVGGKPVKRFAIKSDRDTPHPALLIVRKRGKHILHVRSKESFREGDFSRIGYRWAYAGYLYIVHRDPKGQWTPLYPSNGDARSLRVVAEKEHWFSGSLEVEGKAEGDEMVWACFSKRARSLKTLLKVLPRAGEAITRDSHVSPEAKDKKGERLCEYLLHFVLKRE